MRVVPTRKGRDPGPSGAWEPAQVLHGCRQLVSWDVGLSPRTSATPAPSYQRTPAGVPGTLGGLPAFKSEEGGDDVKSSWPLCPGLHTCYSARYKGTRTREGEPIPKSRAWFGLQAATRLHEVGVASNRGSATPR